MRERTKIEIPQRGGMVAEFPAMGSKLAEIPDGVEWVDDWRRQGQKVRVPVVMIDERGRWWWLGLRASSLVNGGERVAVDGKQTRTQRRIIETDKSGERWFWVVDHSTHIPTGKFHAPLPLASKEDALEYYRRGVHGDASPAQLADRLGWTGTDCTSAAKRFLELVHAVKDGLNAETIARKVAAIPEVVIPSPADMVKARKVSWRELVETVESLKSEVERLRDIAETVESLKSEVERLRGLVI